MNLEIVIGLYVLYLTPLVWFTVLNFATMQKMDRILKKLEDK